LGSADKASTGKEARHWPVEAGMTHIEAKALENAARSSAVWTEAYDGQTHYGEVARALAPALFILAAATALMLAIL
jgi:hypothetical protein